MHNNHDLLCIEVLRLSLANSQNVTHYITVVIWLHFDLQALASIPVYLWDLDLQVLDVILEIKYPLRLHSTFRTSVSSNLL